MTLRIMPPIGEQDFMQEVLTKLKAGDQTAFKTFYEFHYNYVFRFVFRLIGNETDAQDITIESFAVLWQKRHGLQDPNTVRAYLFTISKNAARDRARKIKVTRKYVADASDDIVDEDATNAAIWADMITGVEQRITDLPPGCRNVFEMIYYHNLETDEIARKLSISKQTVLNQKNKAIQLMRRWVALQNNLLLLEVFETLIRKH